MLFRRPAVLALAVTAAVLGTASPALAHESGAHAARQPLAAAAATEGAGKAMRFLANLPHTTATAADGQNGSDIEFMTVGGRDYALAGTLRNGLQVTDISDPAKPVKSSVYDCQITQGDPQVFRQGTRVLATYTADAPIAPKGMNGTRTAANEQRFNAACVREANALGFDIDGSELGTFVVDLTDPAAPRTVSFVEIPKGSHNQTVHPSGDYLYNSNSDLIVNSPLPQVTIFDIRDLAKPRFVQDFKYPPGQPALGEESHDIFFDATGTRAYVASLGSTLILDTSKPETPRIITQFVDPANSLVHQSDIVDLPRKDGTVRTLLITTDEQNGAATNPACPGGGLHVYDITGAKENNPLANKLGVWFIDNTEPREPLQACTSHVLRMHPDQGLMTIAWYTAGVRVLDISGLADFVGSPATVARGKGVGITEVGNFIFPDSDTWSFKTNRIEASGAFFGYGNDLARGLDVYRFEGPLVGGRTVPTLAPEDLSRPGCTGVPVATAYGDRGTAREVHKRGIDCVIARSISQGSVVDAQRVYRPLEDVTRGQMATFILNTLRASGIDQELPAPKSGFTDTAGSVHRPAIEVLAAAGIVQGTGDGSTYEPQALVSREQMASFMVRAAQFAVEPDLAESGARRFTDVPDGSTHAANIAIGDDAGLFSGTTATTFSPSVMVKRDQMASFLTNLLGVAGRGNTVPAGLG